MQQFTKINLAQNNKLLIENFNKRQKYIEKKYTNVLNYERDKRDGLWTKNTKSYKVQMKRFLRPK